MKNLILTIALNLITLISFSITDTIKSTYYTNGVLQSEVAKLNITTYKVINYYENNNIKEIQYYDLNKKRTGIWESFDENGIKTGEASFKNNKKHGIWKVYLNNKLSIILEYKNGKRIKAFMYTEKEGLIASINQ